MKNNNKIMVERETYEKDGKTYFTYFIKGKVRSKEVRIAVTPPDKGGFTVLDIVFGNEMKADLITKPYEIKDDAIHIEGYFEQPEIMSNNLKAKLIQSGVPQSTLQKFLVKGADYV